MNHHQRNGFTLIEVMIVVVIVAILSAIAFPASTQYVQRSYRAEGHNMLMEASHGGALAGSALGLAPFDRRSQTQRGPLVNLSTGLKYSAPVPQTVRSFFAASL